MAGRRGRGGRNMKLNPNFGFDAVSESGISDALLNNARRSGQLNISNRSLTEIPETVWSINSIDSRPKRTLSFADDDSDKWWEGTELTKLNASSNRLRQISNGIQHLPELTSFDVYDNQLENLPPALFELQKLRYVNVSINKLQQLPENIGSCTSLTQFLCQRNQLTGLPNSIGNLHSLESLDCSENGIEQLPPSIANLRLLRTLNLRSNKLTVIPDFLSSVTNLTTLDLSGNRLKVVPDSIGNLSSLVRLDLHQNSLSLCPRLTNCQELRELLLAENQLTDIHPDVLRLPNLVLMDFHFNKLQSIPSAICSMPSLERLDLGKNDLTSLPLEMGLMTNLKSLIVEGNPLRTIRRDVINKGTEAIKKSLVNRMAIDENKELKDQPTIKQTGTNSGAFGDKENEVDPFVVAKQQSLELVNKNLKIVGQHIWQALRDIRLKTVVFRKNFLTDVPPEIFWFSESITHLDIGVNKLSRLPDEIGALTKLQQLDLSGNSITCLPDSFGKLQNLRHLDISYNRFQNIPTVIWEVHELEHLIMASNSVEDLDVNSILKMTHLRTLDLQNNNISKLDPVLGLCEQLTCLKVEGNCFRIPRPALLAKGTDAILEYLRSRIQN